MAFDDEVLKAEIQWTTFTCEKELSPNLSDDASKVFASMFSDSKIASKVSCGRTKATYLISDGIGPEMHSRLVQVMQQHCFSILIDVSNKTHGKKYLNILVRYFNPILQKPETQVLQNWKSAW